MYTSLEKIHAIDFDGTLTKKDTFIEFIRFSFGKKKLLWGLIRFMPQLLGMMMGLIPNEKVKQRVFSYFFKGMSIETFNNLCQRFARTNWKLIRPKGINKIQESLSKQEKVVILSASIENWVKPFFNDIKEVIVIGTIIEVESGIITGKFLSKNCSRKEKVSRLLEVFPLRNAYYLIAYGDSKGDVEILDFANEGYYKPFE